MRQHFLSFFFTLNVIFSFSQDKDTLASKTFRDLDILIGKFVTADFELAKKLSIYYINKGKKEKNPKKELQGLLKYIDVSIINRKFLDFNEEQARMVFLANKYNLQKNLAINYYLIGNSYFFQAVWSSSTKNYLKALNLAKEVKNFNLQSIILTQLGAIKSTIGDHQQAIYYQKEGLKLNRNQKKIKDVNSNASLNRKRLSAEIASLYFISRSYINSKEKDSARSYINEAINLNKSVNDSCLAKALYRTKGEVDLLYNNFKSALSNFKISKTYCLPLTKGDSLLYAACYGSVFIGQRQYKKAINVLQKGIDNYGVTSSEEGFMDDHYKLLAKAYKYSGEIEKSNFYFEKYIHTNEEFGKIQDSIVSIFKKQEAKEFKAELNAIQTKNKKNESYITYLLISGLLLILTLLFLVFKFYKNKAKNEVKFKQLLQKIEDASQKQSVFSDKNIVLEEKSPIEINEKIKQKILVGLHKLEAQEYFLKKECNTYNVAKKIKTNTSYLSKVVKAHYQKNFNTYINDLRINYAILRLKEDIQFRKYSIQSIAEEVGYKSADSFTKYFKKQTDLNPSFYIKKLNNLAQIN